MSITGVLASYVELVVRIQTTPFPAYHINDPISLTKEL